MILDAEVVMRKAADTALQAAIDAVEIVPLGETEYTAYRGNRGKEAYDHSLLKDNPHDVTAAQVGADPAGAAQIAFEQAKANIDIANFI